MSTISTTITGDTPTSVALAALTRTDTGAAVVLSPPLPQPFTDAGGGVWTFTFTDPAAGLSYAYTAVITWPDGSSDAMNGTLASAAPPAGLWATLAMVQQIYGADNIAQWPVIATLNVPDAAWQQAAFNRADTDILSKFARNYFVALSVSAELGWIEAELMGAYLYMANGLQDGAKGMDGKIQGHLDHAWQQLDELLFLNRGGFTRVAGYADAPLVAQPRTTPAGNPVEPNPPWPIPRWDGWRYVWGPVRERGRV